MRQGFYIQADITGLICDFNSFALCCKSSSQRVRRSSKGIKRRMNTRSRPNIRTKQSNLIAVPITREPKRNRCEHPGVILTNCRSITSDKIDELKLLLEDINANILMLTESWLTDDKEKSAQIENYTLHTSNRPGRVGGGVAIYVHNSLDAKVVKKYQTKTTSALWLKVSYRNHTTIYGCLYHPKSKLKSHSDKTTQHLTDTITELSSKITDQFVLGGDFNHLDISDITNLFGFHNLVNFSTRGSAYLDHLYTNLSDLMSIKCNKLPPLAASDHDIIHLPTTSTTRNPQEYIHRRKVTPNSRLNIQREIAHTNWEFITSISDPNQQAK